MVAMGGDCVKVDVERLEMEVARRGLTLKDFANLAGISFNGLTLVRKKGSCMPWTAGRISNALGIELEDLFEKEE